MTRDLRATPPAAAEGREPLAAGVVVDGFLLEERTHQGGMANLWRVSRVAAPGSAAAADAGLPLIMKVPRIRGGDDPTTIVGFEVEQMIMPTLAGPHVPRFIARGDFARQPYIVMERLGGDSLKPRFDAAPIGIDEVAEIGWKVATALHELHRQHVVHLDVKPSNVMFRPPSADDEAAAAGSGRPERGVAVLVDFGLSRHDRLPDLLEEEFELPMGTAPYMSPEQVQFIRNDPRSDLFALGVVLYTLVTGVRPFGSPAGVRGLRQRLYRDPPPPRALRADCPPWLQEVILRCLEVQPARRHQTAAQLAFDLRHPAQVALTARAERLVRDGRLAVLRRWFKAIGAEPPSAGAASAGAAGGDAGAFDAGAGIAPGAAAHAARSPIVLAAVDVAGAEEALLAAVLTVVQRVLQTRPGARLACLAVMKTNRIGMDELVDADGGSRHVKLLVTLKHWARPVLQALDAGPSAAAMADGGRDARVTFHVIEAPDAAAAIVDYARKNQVDHIVMGARSSSALRRYLGSVSARVVAEAGCTVTVVRA